MRVPRRRGSREGELGRRRLAHNECASAAKAIDAIGVDVDIGDQFLQMTIRILAIDAIGVGVDIGDQFLPRGDDTKSHS